MSYNPEDVQTEISEFAKFSTDELLEIDRVCTEYRVSRASYPEITIEQQLERVDLTLQEALFIELLYQEISFQKEQKEDIYKDDFLARFPQYSQQIDKIWFRSFVFAEKIDHIDESSEGNTVPKIKGYKVLSTIARGGAGVVYLAHEQSLQRKVAIKMIASDLVTPEELNRFRNEATAVGALQHPNIAQIFGTGEHHGQPYLILEYLDGGTLKDYLTTSSLSVHEKSKLFIRLVETVEFVHQKGFLHRDIKPSNILFDKAGNMKICDFGLAKNLQSTTEQTQTNMQIGTPAYMAPEQADPSFGEVTAATDIYSLGVLLHWMLSGELPYKGTSTAQIIKELTADSVVSVNKLRQKKLPAVFGSICTRCLKKKPKRRYGSIADLKADLIGVTKGKTISMHPLYQSYPGKTALTCTLLTACLFFAYNLFTTNNNSPKHQTTLAEAPSPRAYAGQIIGSIPGQSMQAMLDTAPTNAPFRLASLFPPDIELLSPQGIAIFDDRYLAVADTLNHRVLILDLQGGQISLIAGNGNREYSGDNDRAILAGLDSPGGLDFDNEGNLYVTDRVNHAIRKITPDGMITTAIGGWPCREELQRKADLCYPNDIDIDLEGEYRVADAFHRRIFLNGSNSLIIDSSFGQGPRPFLVSPTAITSTASSFFYISGQEVWSLNRDLNQESDNRPKNTSSLFAKGFLQPSDLQIGNDNYLYVTDQLGFPLTRIHIKTGEREVISWDSITTQAGSAPVKAQETTASKLALDSKGRLFFTDIKTNTVYFLDISANNSALGLWQQAESVQDNPEQIHPNFRSTADNRKYTHAFHDASLPLVMTELAYQNGLHPVIHPDIDPGENLILRHKGIIPRDMLVFSCFTFGLSCAVEGNWLYIAPKGKIDSLTSAPTLTMETPLSYIEFSSDMPEATKRILSQSISLDEGYINSFPQLIDLINDQYGLQYQFDISESRKEWLNKQNFQLTGAFALDELHSLLTHAGPLSFSYDKQSDVIVIHFSFPD